jgi:hypothetical protein
MEGITAIHTGSEKSLLSQAIVGLPNLSDPPLSIPDENFQSLCSCTKSFE